MRVDLKVFYAFCALTSIGGVIGLIIDVVVLINLSPITQAAKLTDSSLVMPKLMLPVAIIMIFLPCLGSWGARKQKRLILIAFAVSMFILFVILLGIGALGVRKSCTFDVTPKAISGFTGVISDALGGQKSAILLINTIQAKFRCCGATGPEDYITPEAPPKNITDGPSTCCPYRYYRCGKEYQKSNWFRRGCVKPVLQFVRRADRRIGKVSIALSMVVLVSADVAVLKIIK